MTSDPLCVMYLRDIDVRADRKTTPPPVANYAFRFHQETCCVAELLRHLLYRKVETPRIAKLLLVLSDCTVETGCFQKLQSGCGVATLTRPFDFCRYDAATAMSRKELVLEVLIKVFQWLSLTSSWKVPSLDGIKGEAQKTGLILEQFLRKSWTSPGRRKKLRICFRYDIDRIDFYAVVTKPRTYEEIGRFHFASEKPEMGRVWDAVTQVRWINDSQVQIVGTGYPPREWRIDTTDL